VKKLFLTLIIGGLLLSSCTDSKKEVKQIEKDGGIASLTEDEGLKLMQQNCYACHSVVSKSHDKIIAPPMAAIKRRYSMSYPNKKEFMEAFTNWVIDPKEKNALMRGAVMKFKVMPKQNFNKNDIEKISEYIFENEIETPVWFQSHFNNQHSSRMGNGKGRGNRLFN
jgi:mono/diheme cytochrome c family protein